VSDEPMHPELKIFIDDVIVPALVKKWRGMSDEERQQWQTETEITERLATISAIYERADVKEGTGGG